MREHNCVRNAEVEATHDPSRVPSDTFRRVIERRLTCTECGRTLIEQYEHTGTYDAETDEQYEAP